MSFLGIAQTFEIYNGDTINRLDQNYCKDGKWRVTGKLKPGTCYQKDQVVEEGKYIGNRKTGLWTEYFCNGNIRNKINFIDGRPNGHSIMYHENGKKKEEGDWSKGKYNGTFKIFDSTGVQFWEIDLDSLGQYRTVISNNGQTFSQGVFRYRDQVDLMNGIEYTYDQKKAPVKIKMYQNGNYINDLPLKK